MTAPMTQATYVANVIALATARGISDADHLNRIRAEAMDFWNSRLNASYSGEPSGSVSSS